MIDCLKIGISSCCLDHSIYFLLFNCYSLLFSEVKCPMAILGAQHDHLSPPELVKQFEEILKAKSVVNHVWTVGKLLDLLMIINNLVLLMLFSISLFIKVNWVCSSQSYIMSFSANIVTCYFILLLSREWRMLDETSYDCNGNDTIIFK